MATIYPLGDRLKVLALLAPDTTRGGIVIPDAAEVRQRPQHGVVLEVGRGKTLETGAVVPLECEPGDVVAFGKYAGIIVFDEAIGHDVLLMREDEALGRQKRDELPATLPGDPREVGDAAPVVV